jgi:molybdenum cofactor synthesis domain-containing protein
MAASAPTAGIVLIGDELLSGKVDDENARVLVADLRELGVGLRRVSVIPDLVDEIAETVRDFAGRYDHVFTSGGVGPTHDDLTMEGIARAFGRQVVRDPTLEGLLREYYGARLQDRDLRMADVPDGAHFLRGAAAQWPVVALENVYIFPGVPQIFRRKWDSVRERFRAAPFHLRCVFSSLEEGHIAATLDRVVADHAAVQVGSYPLFQGVDYKVKITLESKDAAQVDAATEALVLALGPAVVRVT